MKLKTEDKLLQNAIIYKREEHLLRSYEKAVNDAARELVTTDPSLMFDRNALFEKSRQKVRKDGYVFKKDFSRSKFHQSASPSLQPKNTLSNDRKTRMLKITEQLQVINDQIMIKEKRKSKAEQVKDYQLCDKLLNEKKKLLPEKLTLESEMKLLQRKEQKSNWCYSKKKVNSAADHAKPNSKDYKSQTSLHSYCTAATPTSLPQQSAYIDLGNYSEPSPSINDNGSQKHSINTDLLKCVSGSQQCPSIRGTNVNAIICPQSSQTTNEISQNQSVSINTDTSLQDNPSLNIDSHPKHHRIHVTADNCSQQNSSVTINIHPQQGLPAHIDTDYNVDKNLSFSNVFQSANDKNKHVGEKSKDF